MSRPDTSDHDQRRLAGILCADICGYSRLVAEDEASTLRLLARYRGISEHIIRHYGGRVANTAGDSLLVEFPSATDGVLCALDLQARIATANEDVHPDRRILFRVGLHVGEVSVRHGDLFGDAVNVAARLQAIAPPGRVCVSAAAFQFAAKTDGVSFEANGAHQVKNIPAAIMTYLASAPTFSRNDIPTVHRRILFHLARRFHTICDEALREIISAADLAPTEYAALASLEDAPGLDQLGLALRIGLDDEQTAPILEKLLSSKLIRASESQSDQAGPVYELTVAGSEIRQRYRPAIVAAIDRIVAPLSEAERHAFHDLLARVIRGNQDHGVPPR